MYLSKSDFKLAQSCATKLFYAKKNYPNERESDPLLDNLADGGFLVAKLAQLMFPEGIEIKSDQSILNAHQVTLEMLLKEEVTLFEPLLIANRKLARVDILRKRGNELELIEVKAKSFDGTLGNEQFWSAKKDKIASGWDEYLRDIAFQVIIAREAFPQMSIRAFLMMTDKTKTTGIEGLAKQFQLNEVELDSGRKGYKVDFTGSLEAIHQDQFLTRIEVTNEVEFLIPLIRNDIAQYLDSLGENGEIKKIATPIGRGCKGCEFFSENKAESGFDECWGELAKPTPHFFELYWGLDDEKTNQLIETKSTSLFDIPLDWLKNKKGDFGSRGLRQKIQIENTRSGKVWIGNGLKQELQHIQYPVHFIDFETYQSALPYHRGMRAYERIAFQWSVHTLSSPDAEPTHSEFLNTEAVFPNFTFAESLMKKLGNSGTILIWTQYENTVLRAIYQQLQDYAGTLHIDAAPLLQWLESTAKIEGVSDGRMVDMNKLCFDYFFHPMMKGSTSIKAVLPAVWKDGVFLHELSWLKKYVKVEKGEVLSPYKALESIEIFERAERVEEGMGAMRAYEEMIYGRSAAHPEKKQKWEQLLLEYCKLDTLAMVIIWKYWLNKCGT
ncbi:MAG: DUF2779 domain-containing protein [Chloroherpetonaceae bacterium]|nr:DUF2779 domain-containing protein [Chloroherpetonaceae bacterium]